MYQWLSSNYRTIWFIGLILLILQYYANIPYQKYGAHGRLYYFALIVGWFIVLGLVNKYIF